MNVAHADEFVLPSTDIDVCGGIRLRAARFPNGIVDTSRAMLCIPGYAAAGESFARLRPLAIGCDIHMLTLPEDGWRYADPIQHFGSIVGDFADHFDQPVLLGTSFGGLVAIDAARRLGSRIRGLVLISTFAKPPFGRLRTRAISSMLPLLHYAAAHLQSFGIRFIGGPKLDSAALFELRRQANSISRRERHCRFVAALHTNLSATVSKIAVPALIVHGVDDHLIPIAAARELVALLPHAEIVEISDAGHLPYLTHPAETNAAISRFLERTSVAESRFRSEQARMRRSLVRG